MATQARSCGIHLGLHFLCVQFLSTNSRTHMLFHSPKSNLYTITTQSHSHSNSKLQLFKLHLGSDFLGRRRLVAVIGRGRRRRNERRRAREAFKDIQLNIDHCLFKLPSEGLKVNEGYQFWTQADENGNFEIKGVIPASYIKTIDWSKWHVYWTEERVVAKTHVDNNYRLAKEGLLSKERKTELNQAIINMEQGGSADGILQVHADRTQSELEELMKVLAERSKKHGIEIKSAAIIKLPQGWQPGITEGASVWDEEWDKFEDEGLAFDKDPKADSQNGTTVSKTASTSFLDDMSPLDGGFSPDSMSNTEKHSTRSEHVLDSESGYPHSEDDSARSPQDSPAHPASEFSDVFAKTSEADSDFHRGFDDQGWGTFDGSDDVDSVWGFNANSKDSGHDRDGVFDSGSFGLSSIRTDSNSPQARGNFNNKNSVFADSVPGTPFSKSASSPRYSEAGDSFFNNYSGFDFLSNQETQFLPPVERGCPFDPNQPT